MKLVDHLEEMLKLQHNFNLSLDRDYLDHNYDWQAAILVEVGELLEAEGYQWWKKTEVDTEGIGIELVDILHFVLSFMIQTNYNQLSFQNKASGPENQVDPLDFHELAQEAENFWPSCEEIHSDPERSKISPFIYTIFENSGDIASYFLDYLVLAHKYYTDLEIYQMYLMKNALNKLRQTYGYIDGKYSKLWEYECYLIEDNRVALKILKQLPADQITVSVIYDALEEYYKNHHK